MRWDVAKSLDKLLAQINEMAPGRSKASDGSIGDTAHQAESFSDHNPEDKPGSEPDEVDARDFTHDPAHGADMFQISEALRQSRDYRIKYVIFYDRYFSPKTGWAWVKYTGANKHRKHMHVSVNDKDDDSTTPWLIRPSGVPFPGRVLKIDTPLMRGEDVKRWQEKMLHLYRLEVDGVFGEESERTCREFQRTRGLTVDGEVGPATWARTFA